MKNIEIWKDVIGFERSYQVSNLGNIKSLDRYVKNLGNSKSFIKGKNISKQIDKYGYLRVVLSINSKKHFVPIHRIVAIAFIPNIKKNPCVNHINGIKTDNRIENLEWCTVKENNNHAVLNNLNNPTKGEINGMSKLTEKEVLEIRTIGSNLKLKDISKIYNISLATISLIRSRKAWKHI